MEVKCGFSTYHIWACAGCRGRPRLVLLLRVRRGDVAARQRHSTTLCCAGRVYEGVTEYGIRETWFGQLIRFSSQASAASERSGIVRPARVENVVSMAIVRQRKGKVVVEWLTVVPHSVASPTAGKSYKPAEWLMRCLESRLRRRVD